jgi:peroxiredoxin
MVRPLLIALFGCLLLCGCQAKPKPPAPAESFSDTVAWAEEPPKSLEEIEFQDTAGNPVNLQQFRGKKHVVLVITRGYQTEGYRGSVCVYCASQTARLMANYEQFRSRNAEVLVVFPVVKSSQVRGEKELIATARNEDASLPEQPPFPIWIDNELKAVRHLGIEQSLAKPATYLIDQAGRVRFTYVGNRMTDRPSIKAMLDKLDEINQERK